ncbi:hypothetical protein [Pleomorphomonas sp. JP5]|uniref:hypothetical protein n=1 Tax=Pleomorphomonas sp. JP5 TaxID=2942998 RepID=UPI0020440137|nr:hypothetical protein [Pleomorphomonas sp. JP5]MCM5557462.1 hypothetical protein [Pleomorphomonas sp. JP5]
MIQRVLLAGGTGLVGGLVRSHLASRLDVSATCLVRPGAPSGGHEVEFERLTEAPAALLGPLAPEGIDVGISCLGTTIRAAGSEQAMFRVDHDYVLAVAQGARALGARQFILVTSAGAGGPGFYLKTKGAIEQAVTDLGFERVDIIRPGMLIGERRERRPMEAFGQRLFDTLAPVMIGPLSRYAGIHAETVADAIVALIGHEEAGRFVHENDELTALSRP